MKKRFHRQLSANLPPLLVAAGALSTWHVAAAQEEQQSPETAAEAAPAQSVSTESAPEEVVVVGRSLSASEALVEERLADPSVVDAISAGDGNTVRDVVFRNIRVDHIEEGKLINVRVVFNDKYSFSPGRAVEGITFQNITHAGKGWAGKSVLGGYDEGRRVSNVVFDNVRIDGARLRGPQDGSLDIGPFVDGLVFK